MSSVTSQQMIDAGSDDTSDTDFFNSSLSIWRGPKSSLEGSEDPVPLDLHTASSIGNYDIVRTYINSEADLNAKNSGGYTPLMYAAYIGHDNIVNLLLDAQVDVNLANNKGLTPLMLAASCGNEGVCDFLKDTGADLEAKDKKGWTALFHATYNGHQNIVKFLLESGANIDAMEPKYGFTPLMQAAYQGHEIIVQCLLLQGANRHLTSRIGDTAQSLAMKKAYRKIVTLLESKSPAHTHLRKTSPYSSGGSDDERSGMARTPRNKKLNINDGPQALSKMMSPQVQLTGQKGNVKFKEPVVTPILKNSKQREVVASVTPHYSQQDDCNRVSNSMQSLTLAPGNNTNRITSQQLSPTAKVSPTPKVINNKPADVHELLEQLGLLKYEAIFIEQDIDLEIFMTLSDGDLKEIGVVTFGPRRKMTNAIKSWHSEHGTQSVIGNDDNSQMASLVEQLKEKTWQLNQAYSQLAGYHSNIEHYHKELEHEKNIRSLTESYLLNEKARFDEVVRQCKDIRLQCSKALKNQGKVKNIYQLVRARHDDNLPVGELPQQLQDTLSITDAATKTQISALSNSSTSELWDGLQQGLRDASTSTAMAIFNLDKLVKISSEEH